MSSDENSVRSMLTSRQRVTPAKLSIDPGFVNHRLIESYIGDRGMAVVNAMINELPALPDWLRETRINHIYTRVMLQICENVGVASLSKAMSERHGTIFCSVEKVEATPTVYTAPRVSSRIVKPGFTDITATLEYSTSMIRADTTRAQIFQGHDMALIGKFMSLRGNEAVLAPLVIGSPWLVADENVIGGPEWYSHDFFENFIEDIDEFDRVAATPTPSDFSIMREISERAFKQCLGELLGDSVVADWGGEQSDHFTSHLHLGGKRHSAAFLLKGPARFSPMGLNHLGKNNDQIYRLSAEPAELLVVQHCHDVLPAVRATLRAFAVQPGQSRRYCVIDGRDSLRLLQAYDKVDRAMKLSKQ